MSARDLVGTAGCCLSPTAEVAAAAALAAASGLATGRPQAGSGLGWTPSSSSSSSWRKPARVQLRFGLECSARLAADRLRASFARASSAPGCLR